MAAWDSVKKVIASVAPTLATALGTPVAGVAIAAIMNALGVKTEDEAVAALKNDPAAILQLRLAEIEFQKFLKQADIDLEKLAVEDRASARTMAIATGNRPQAILALIYTVGYFTIMVGLLTSWLVLPTEGGAQTLFAGLIGIMSGAQVTILQFFFGSSSGSQKKDETIKEQAMKT